MYDNEHGMDLAKLLAGSDTQISSQHPLLGYKEVDGYRIKWAVLSYDNGVSIGVFYLEWETPGKKGMSPLKHQNLAAIRLGSNDYVAEQTIDDLMQPSEIGIPTLRTSKYLIADGSEADKLYNRLIEEPPMTGQDLANVLMRYAGGTGHYNGGRRWASKIPTQRMRTRLGR